MSSDGVVGIVDYLFVQKVLSGTIAQLIAKNKASELRTNQLND
jgi:hypothetical protein